MSIIDSTTDRAAWIDDATQALVIISTLIGRVDRAAIPVGRLTPHQLMLLRLALQALDVAANGLHSAADSVRRLP